MTTHDNTKAKLKAFDAFAPVADALDAIPNLDVPGVARDFAKRVTAATQLKRRLRPSRTQLCLRSGSSAASVEPFRQRSIRTPPRCSPDSATFPPPRLRRMLFKFSRTTYAAGPMLPQNA
jgi:hypothetical protein